MRSNASTTVTFVPSLDQTDPISKPIYPPPITNIDFGTDCRERAPVDVTICFSSIGILGISIEEDPVAIIKFLAESFFSSFADLTRIVLLSIKDAEPLICSILFFLNRKPIPPVSCFTILSFTLH